MTLHFGTPATTVTVSWIYLAGVAGATVIIRVIMCWLVVWEFNVKHPTEKIHFFSYFFSRKSVPNGTRDFFHPWIIGTLELLVYPLLIASWNLQLIGAWLVFKTATGWKKGWRERASYNRFLIGNGLVIGASALLAQIVGTGHS